MFGSRFESKRGNKINRGITINYESRIKLQINIKMDNKLP